MRRPLRVALLAGIGILLPMPPAHGGLFSAK
jgi:hypothetical protein